MVSLSAPILTQSFAPNFSGRIEVDITAEDLPAGDPHLRATNGQYKLRKIRDIYFVEGIVRIVTAGFPTEETVA